MLSRNVTMNWRLIVPAILSLALADPAAAESHPTPGSRCPPGFAALQNSDTCVRISGRVRADGVVGSPLRRSSDSFATHASGRVQLDVRTRTEYGPLRAVLRVENRRR
jgi:Porin subfamily